MSVSKTFYYVHVSVQQNDWLVCFPFQLWIIFSSFAGFPSIIIM